MTVRKTKFKKESDFVLSKMKCFVDDYCGRSECDIGYKLRTNGYFNTLYYSPDVEFYLFWEGQQWDWWDGCRPKERKDLTQFHTFTEWILFLTSRRVK